MIDFAQKVRKKWGIDKGAGAFEAGGQTKEEFSINDISRHPKLFKIGPNHGCQ